MIGKALLAASAAVLLLTGCDPGTTTTSPPTTPTQAAPSVEPSVEPEPEPDPDVLDQYADLAFRIADTSDEMSTAAFTYDVDALTVGCANLLGEAAEGAALPDTNVPGVDKPWDRAMDHYMRAANACINGDYETSATFIDKANASIARATTATEAWGN